MAESIREKSQMMKDARFKVGRMLFSKNGQMVFGDMWFTDILLTFAWENYRKLNALLTELLAS